MSVLTQFLAAGRRTARFTSSGSWVVPAGVMLVDVLLVGGGGGGAKGISSDIIYGGGGQGGQVAFYRNIPVFPGQTISVTVGAGGAGGSAAGSPGGSSMVSHSASGLQLSASGGSGANVFAYPPSRSGPDPSPYYAGEKLPFYGTLSGYSNDLFSSPSFDAGGACLQRGVAYPNSVPANTGCGGWGITVWMSGNPAAGASGLVCIFY